MAGAWEIRQANSVLTAILHTEMTTVAWALGLRNLMLPGPIAPLAGMPYDHARNEACKALLQGSYEWLFFLDSDVIPPRDAVPRLLARNLPIVSGLYCRRSPPHGLPVAIKNGNWLQQYMPGSLVEVDLVGAGCLLIHRTVLEKLPPQQPGRAWFNWKVDLREHLPEGEGLSEDFTFCLWARKHGYKVILDTGVVCRHVGNAQATPGLMMPLETTPVT